MELRTNYLLHLFLIFSGIFLSSCLKEYPVPVSGNSAISETVTVEMGETYKNQIYYDLEENVIVDIKDKDAWDVALTCSDTSHHLLLNSAKIMGAVHLENATLQSSVSTSGHEWEYESPEGYYAQSPLYNWDTKGGIYLVDAGLNYLGQHQGYYKMQAELVENGVRIRWMKTGETEEHEFILQKDPAYNSVGLSFIHSGFVETEPPADSWDLKFSVYTHIFEGHMPYSVVGALVNPNKSFALKTENPFSETDFNTLQGVTLKSELNTIGYDWKEFNFDQSLYEVYSHFTYLIRTRNEMAFKLRFVDFYSPDGIKGYPTFELESL